MEINNYNYKNHLQIKLRKYEFLRIIKLKKKKIKVQHNKIKFNINHIIKFIKLINI